MGSLRVNSLSNSFYKSATNLTPNIPRSAHGGAVPDHHPAVKEADRLLLLQQQDQCSLEEWETARQEAITHMKHNVSSKERLAWSSLLQEKDSKGLWHKINWKGTCDDATSKKPQLQDLKKHFMQKGQSTEDYKAP